MGIASEDGIYARNEATAILAKSGHSAATGSPIEAAKDSIALLHLAFLALNISHLPDSGHLWSKDHFSLSNPRHTAGLSEWMLNQWEVGTALGVNRRA